jgi:tetratricopeptide (TPR) repeat protein
MIRSVTALLVVFILSSVAAAQSSPPGANTTPPSPDRMKAAVTHFEKAFYDLTPKQKHAEANAEFDLAVTGFESVLADTPASVEAHTYLARIHNARKEFRQAAAQWDKVAAIQPFDVDACLFAAGAYADAGEFAEARLRLSEARLRTRDPDVLVRLDGYAAKLDAVKR